MKRLTTIVALGLLVAGNAAATDAGTCYTISDPDHRALCLAKAHKDSGRCYSIQRQDLRAECQAETRK
ncbi:hypothetical protein ST4_090 [Aeromonas phage ST4]|nr:hypothetical protein ST4_090 [Aeromonas phage ST4]